MTKVDFKALDKFQVKPVGIYGSKEEIIRFLFSVGAIDETTYVNFYFVIRFLLLTPRQLGKVNHFPGRKNRKTNTPLWPIHLPRFGVRWHSGKNVCSILAGGVNMGRRCFSSCSPESCNFHEVNSPWNILTG